MQYSRLALGAYSILMFRFSLNSLLDRCCVVNNCYSRIPLRIGNGLQHRYYLLLMNRKQRKMKTHKSTAQSTSALRPLLHICFQFLYPFNTYPFRFVRAQLSYFYEKDCERESERVEQRIESNKHDIEVGLEVKMSLQYTRTKEISLYE